MKTTGSSQKIKWDFTEKVAIPPRFKPYLWDYEDEASLEILITRVFQYGNFDEKFINFTRRKVIKSPTKTKAQKRSQVLDKKMENLYELAIEELMELT